MDDDFKKLPIGHALQRAIELMPEILRDLPQDQAVMQAFFMGAIAFQTADECQLREAADEELVLAMKQRHPMQEAFD